MYRCEICQECSQPGQNLVKHVTYREHLVTKVIAGQTTTTMRKEIHKERSICQICKKLLDMGHNIPAIRHLVEQKRLRDQVNAQLVARGKEPIFTVSPSCVDR